MSSASPVSSVGHQLQVRLITPEGAIDECSPKLLLLPGHDGYIAIGVDHAPMLAQLKLGYVAMFNQLSAMNTSAPLPLAQADELWVLNGGLLDVSDLEAHILAEEAWQVNKHNELMLKRQIKEVDDALKLHKDDAIQVQTLTHRRDVLLHVQELLVAGLAVHTPAATH